ncbi:RNA polymerase sigma factor [Nonlabens xiamenensis]|uniref:RNA polymerase sigma factor n=1 Tax=Nonlabens xiamenensis TaxID=2341043 RepID=UPI000F606C27|nr:sigma-70 family RNA polymerase sigma factor [Nonlabens xiamenensis]
MSFTDRHIEALFMEGDSRAMGLIYERYAGVLFGVAVKLTQEKNLAQEVLQLSLIKIWEKSDTFDRSKSKLFTWMFQITRNTALDEIRKKQRSKEIQITDRDVYLDENVYDKETLEQLRQQLGQMDPKHREVLDAIFFKGLTHKAASSHLSMPLGTLKTRLRNALKELRLINKGLYMLLLSLLS